MTDRSTKRPGRAFEVGQAREGDAGIEAEVEVEVEVEISLIAPVHDEVESLGFLFEETRRALDGAVSSWELVLVDDHSSDGSREAIRDLEREHSEVQGLYLGPASVGAQGQSAALAAGFRAARGALVATIDADLQNDPADLPTMIALLSECDLVSGVRADRHDSWKRRAASRVANGVRRMALGDPFTDIGCSLKVYRREHVRHLPWFDGMHRYLPIFAVRRGARPREIVVAHRARRFGESKYTIGGRLLRGLRDLVAVRWLLHRQVRPPAGRVRGGQAVDGSSLDRNGSLD